MMAAFTLFHVVLSLIGIASGFVVIAGMFSSNRMDGVTAIFLTTTTLTSVTGFFFPVHHFMPSHAIGILSLIVLAIAIYARYGRHLTGAWRWIYVVTAIIAQYFNVFVGVVQAFEKIPPLHSLAPTQSEPPFAITQGVVLLLFLVVGIVSAKRFHPMPNVPMAA
jgi:hypothetical protein